MISHVCHLANQLCQIQPGNMKDLAFIWLKGKHVENSFAEKKNRLLNVVLLWLKAKHHAENNTADQNKLLKSS